jgi:hypothetical protein
MLRIIPLFFLISNAFALVEYGETTPVRRVSKAPVSTGKSWYRGIDMGVGFLALKNKDKELNQIELNAKYQTDFNLYLDTSFWAAKVNGDNFGPGNLETKIGFSFLSAGGPHNLATIDLLAGVNFSTWDSNYASGRVDQVYSLFSTKRFHSIILGIGGQWRITGDSRNVEVASIGNIGTYSAMLGWEISRDIKVFVEGGLVTLAPGEANDSGNYLTGKAKYTYISPLLQLGIFSQLWVELGAAFRINNEGYDDSLASARLFDLKGIYGNSLFTGLKYSL